MFSVPVLHGCKISITGLTSEKREEISQLVRSLGGIYSGDMNKSITHLITTPDYADGSRSPKIQFALKWSLPLVDLAWLEACNEKQSKPVDH